MTAGCGCRPASRRSRSSSCRSSARASGADVLQAAAAVAGELRAAGVRVRVDDRPEYRPGFKFNEWELKGVPLRIEIGARDLAAAAVTVARRDTGDKQQIPLARAAAAIDELLSDVQASLFADRPRRTGAADAARPEPLRRDDRVPPRARRVRRGAVVRPAASARRASRRTAPRRSAACRSESSRPRPALACAAAGRRWPQPSGRRRTSACASHSRRPAAVPVRLEWTQ